MSLLDDVSIVVTPNGYKAGELYAVVPVPTEGAEEVTNGDFSTDSDWTKGVGWAISGGSANANNTVGDLRQENVVENGKYYKVTYTISNYVSGSVRFEIPSNIGAGVERTANGTYTETLLSRGTAIQFDGRTSFTGSIDNVSVKEYTSADMDVTRETAATRVDEDGLVNYAEVIGSEEIDLTTGSTTIPSNWGSITTNGISYLAQIGTVEYYDTGFTVTSGITYKLSFTLSDYTGSSNLGFSGTGGVSNNARLEADGSYSEYFIASSTAELRLFGRDTNTGVFSNVSVKEVTRDNVPRIDYTGGGCPHILAEPQRTNLFIQNDISTWNGFGSYADETTAPDGTTINFVNMEDRRIFPTTTISNSTEYTSSIYLKGNKTADVKLRNPSGNDTVITLSTEWQRFELTTTSVGTITNTLLIDGRFSQGMGASGLEVAIYGGQLEEGSYPTSYIPTSGSTVTRNKDIFTRDGIGSLINSTEGTLVIEPRYFINDGTSRKISISDGTSTNRIYITPYQGLTSRIRYIFTSGGATQADLQVTGIDITISRKLAFVWKTNRFELWQNGFKISEDTSGTTPSAGTFNQINFGSETGNGTELFEGQLKQLQVYNTALTDAQLTSLTS